jgi:hypothetical protein
MCMNVLVKNTLLWDYSSFQILNSIEILDRLTSIKWIGNAEDKCILLGKLPLEVFTQLFYHDKSKTQISIIRLDA